MIVSFKDEYRWLSNFVDVEVELDGVKYKSVEHAYQAAKSLDEEWRAYCSSDIRPAKVKRASRSIAYRVDWEEIKVDVMRSLLIQKFSKEKFKYLLLATGTTYIKEGNTWGDIFWGVHLKSGEGKNILGLLIMEIRESLKSELKIK